MGRCMMENGKVIPFIRSGHLETPRTFRIIVGGRNDELPRDVFSRRATLHSGMKPESAPGGARSSLCDKSPPTQEAPGNAPPGADWWQGSADFYMSIMAVTP